MQAKQKYQKKEIDCKKNSNQLPITFNADYSQKHIVIQYEIKLVKGHNSSKNKNQNQDSYIIQTNIQNKANSYFFAICDGHGQQGPAVSQFISEKFSKILLQEQHLHNDPINSLQKSIQNLHEQLLQSKIDVINSGSSITSVFIIENQLYCMNIGNSRTVLGIQDQRKDQGIHKNKYIFQAVQLSDDHNFYVKNEKNRAIQNGALIHPISNNNGNYVGPPRIWCKGKQEPGLGMSRSLGDTLAHSIGVSYEPDIKKHIITEDCKFIILASDGIWEQMNNKEVVDLIGLYYQRFDIKAAIESLSTLATFRRQSYQIKEDISIILIFLPQKY